MDKVRFGSTNLEVSRTGLGGIPIQRVSENEAVAILQRSYEAGINLYDTARVYTDSEDKIGVALSDVRENIIICSKTRNTDRDSIMKDIDITLKCLKTDYVDIYQFHNPSFVPKPGDGTYDVFADLKRQGMIRHIGISNHSLSLAKEAVSSGHYEILQYPLSPLSSDEEFELSALCMEEDMGLLGMKGLSGGIITKAITSFTVLRQYENIVPIWGVQKMSELEEFIAFENDPPEMTDEIRMIIDKDRAELTGKFCRGCGYCLPCPVGIKIPFACKMALSIFRFDEGRYLTAQWRDEMDKIKNCEHCNHCKTNCPYGLDVPTILESELAKYDVLYEMHLRGVPLVMPE